MLELGREGRGFKSGTVYFLRARGLARCRAQQSLGHRWVPCPRRDGRWERCTASRAFCGQRWGAACGGRPLAAGGAAASGCCSGSGGHVGGCPQRLGARLPRCAGSAGPWASPPRRYRWHGDRRGLLHEVAAKDCGRDARPGRARPTHGGAQSRRRRAAGRVLARTSAARGASESWAGGCGLPWTGAVRQGGPPRGPPRLRAPGRGRWRRQVRDARRQRAEAPARRRRVLGTDVARTRSRVADCRRPCACPSPAAFPRGMPGGSRAPAACPASPQGASVRADSPWGCPRAGVHWRRAHSVAPWDRRGPHECLSERCPRPAAARRLGTRRPENAGRICPETVRNRDCAPRAPSARPRPTHRSTLELVGVSTKHTQRRTQQRRQRRRRAQLAPPRRRQRSLACRRRTFRAVASAVVAANDALGCRPLGS